jgi:hypothetical protein
MAVMGQLQRRDNEEDDTGGEEAGLVLGGLDDLDSDDAEVVYELDEWSDADRVVLRSRLELLGAPHQWEGSNLVVSASDESWVERILDQLEDELALRLDADAEQVAYDLDGWGEADRQSLLDLLVEAGIAHSFDGDELFVHEIDEVRTDELIERVIDPDAELPDPDAAQAAMSSLFAAGDHLRRDPRHHDGIGALLAGLEAAAGSSPPYGMDAAWWGQTVEAADALADALDAEPGDDDEVRRLASELRERLRPYV